MLKSDVVIVGIVIISFVLNCIALPLAPEKIVTHWDSKGVSDGYMEKAFGLFMLSAILAMIAAIFVAMPKLEEAKTKMKKFLPFYYLFSIWFMLLLLFVNVRVVLWNLDIIKLNPLAVVGLPLLLLALGLIFLFFKAKVKTWTYLKARVFKK